MNLESIIAFDFLNPYLDQAGLKLSSSLSDEEFQEKRIMRIGLKAIAMLVAFCVLVSPIIIAGSRPAAATAFILGVALSTLTGVLAQQHEKTWTEIAHHKGQALVRKASELAETAADLLKRK